MYTAVCCTKGDTVTVQYLDSHDTRGHLRTSFWSAANLCMLGAAHATRSILVRVTWIMCILCMRIYIYVYLVLL